jgi:hypothetical protein
LIFAAFAKAFGGDLLELVKKRVNF